MTNKPFCQIFITDLHCFLWKHNRTIVHLAAHLLFVRTWPCIVITVHLCLRKVMLWRNLLATFNFRVLWGCGSVLSGTEIYQKESLNRDFPLDWQRLGYVHHLNVSVRCRNHPPSTSRISCFPCTHEHFFPSVGTLPKWRKAALLTEASWNRMICVLRLLRSLVWGPTFPKNLCRIRFTSYRTIAFVLIIYCILT